MMKYNNNSEKQCFGFGINAGTAEGQKTNQALTKAFYRDRQEQDIISLLRLSFT